MLNSFSATYKDVRLRQLGKCDIEMLRIWRNRKENKKFLSEIPYITKKKQKKWYEDYSLNDSTTIFAIDYMKYTKKLIGSVSLYNIEKDKAEFGQFLIGNHMARGKGLGFISLVICLYIGYTQFNLSEIYLNVHKENKTAYNIYKKVGFKKVINMDKSEEHRMKLDKRDFYNRIDWLDDILLKGTIEKKKIGRAEIL